MGDRRDAPASTASSRSVLRYDLPVDAATVEVVTACLWAGGALGVWERPDGVTAWFEGVDGEVPDLLPPARGGRLTVEPEQDWQAAWKATIEPVRAGRFLVVPTWLVGADEGPADHESDDVVLVLDPGQAFGTGHHATTALCLTLLDRLDLAGVTLADVGCGSGILAIAAAACGARAVGSDIDPEAVTVARDNAARNDVEVPFAVGSVDAATGLLGGPADVVVANLVTDTVAALAADLVGALRPGGVLVASGIADDRREVALDPLVAAGLVVDEVVDRDGWIALRGRAGVAGSRVDVAPADPRG